MIGIASAGKKEFIESLGVTHVTYGDGVADRIRAVAPDGVDAIFDLVGGDALRSVAGLVKNPSKLITAADPTTAGEYGGGAVARACNDMAERGMHCVTMAELAQPTRRTNRWGPRRRSLTMLSSVRRTATG